MDGLNVRVLESWMKGWLLLVGMWDSVGLELLKLLGDGAFFFSGNGGYEVPLSWC